MIGIAHWPGKIKPGVSDVLVSSMDIFPTFSALAGIDLPADRSYDGMDLSPVLLEGKKKHHTYLFHPSQSGELVAIRKGKYKVHLVF